MTTQWSSTAARGPTRASRVITLTAHHPTNLLKSRNSGKFIISSIFEVKLVVQRHQVAGRNPMFELSSHQILKPLNQREAEFYQRFPRSLKEPQAHYYCREVEV